MVCNTSTSTTLTLHHHPHHSPSQLTLTTHHAPLNFHPHPHQVCNTSTTVVVNVQSGQRFSGAGARFLFLSLNGQAMRSSSKWIVSTEEVSRVVSGRWQAASSKW